MNEVVRALPYGVSSGKSAVSRQPDGNLLAETIHVLLVDDERLSRLVVGNLLKKCNYKVTAVSTGMQALEALRTNGAGTFQLVLTDVMMPDVDGIELLRHVRQDDSLGSVPVVMMSANEHPDTVFECIRAGAEDYLLKPLTKKEVQYIWQHVWRRKHQPALRVSPQPVQEQAARTETPFASQQPSSSSTRAQQPAQPALKAHHDNSDQQQTDAAVATGEAQSAHAPDMAASLESQSGQQASQQQTAPATSDVILVSRYLSQCQSAMSTENGFRIFCAVLALLQPSHAQGIPVQTIRPSQLLLHRSAQVTTQRDLPLSVSEAELYASPEELATGRSTPASDIFSLGVLFFELLNPNQDAQIRTRVLTEVRRRVLPVSLGQHRPHETAFLLALLHPEASKRPTVAQIIGSNLLNMLRSSVHQHPLAQAGPAAPQMLAQQQRLAEEQYRRQHHALHQQELSQHGNNMQQQQKQRQQSQQVAPLEGVDSETLLDFLSIMQQTTVTAMDKTQHQLSLLGSDIQEVNAAILSLQCQHGVVSEQLPGLLHQSSAPEQLLLQPRAQAPLELQHPASRKRQRSWEAESAESQSVSGSLGPWHIDNHSEADSKRERIQQSCQNVDRAFGELERKFFLQRENPDGQAHRASPDLSDSSHVDLPGLAGLSDHLADFSADLIDFSRYSQLKVKAELNYSDLLTVTDMVCSTAFDRDDEFFATAGVFRRVKIFDFASVQDSDTSIHYPVLEIPSRSKLSSVCWNSYVKSNLICSDYEGVVQLWDVSQQAETMTFEEHAKRVWSVDFSQTDPTRFLSGSDDGTVRLWSIADESAVACIDSKANVCSVQFSPTNSNLMAFGSANYRVYLYDLRQISAPLAVIGGHTKAVSYVRWVGGNQVISASTDNSLKLWDVADAAQSEGNCAPITSFTGHTNEKNFVGLSVSKGGYVACGSENNAVYCYNKAVPTPICDHKFGTPGQSHDPIEAHQFVSSVCWSRKSNTMISANSMGNIKVLELV
ncbi:TPA: hypothetical protein ACH3X3_010979 [Trebouxia sp. C0006]